MSAGITPIGNNPVTVTLGESLPSGMLVAEAVGPDGRSYFVAGRTSTFAIGEATLAAMDLAYGDLVALSPQAALSQALAAERG